MHNSRAYIFRANPNGRDVYARTRFLFPTRDEQTFFTDLRPDEKLQNIFFLKKIKKGARDPTRNRIYIVEIFSMNFEVNPNTTSLPGGRDPKRAPHAPILTKNNNSHSSRTWRIRPKTPQKIINPRLADGGRNEVFFPPPRIHANPPRLSGCKVENLIGIKE